MFPARLLALAPMVALLCAAAPPVTFTAADADLRAQTEAYRQLWEAEGARMIAALEEASGVPFPAGPVEIIVYRGNPMAPYDGRSIWLKAGYPPYYMRATLVHELGHLLAHGLPRSAELDDHRLLFLFLYEAWSALYGHDFAARMARSERGIQGRYDYDAAWRWALAMTPDERRARLRELRAVSPGNGAP
jgi:hypothetical protein